MEDTKQKSASRQRTKPAEYETTADPYKQLVNALNGFNGWTLPPLNPRVDTRDNK